MQKTKNSTVWVCIVLQSLMMIGGLYAYKDKWPDIITLTSRSIYKLLSVLLNNCIDFKPNQMAYLITYLLGINVIGIIALILSLIVWFKHKDKNGKITMIASIVVITVNSLLGIDSIISIS